MNQVKSSIKLPEGARRRLVIFEGIMGSGKSTSTRWLGQQLTARNIAHRIQMERVYPHPLRATDAAGDWFKPWLDMTPQALASRRMALWTTFVAEALASPEVHVIDGQLFHGDVTNMLLMNMSPAAIAEHVLALDQVMRPLHPLVVYYHQSDIDQAIRRTAAERGEELGVRYQVDWKLKYPYAVERKLEGLDGLSRLYVDYRALTDSLFARLSLDKLAIENTAGDWPTYYAQIEEALGF